MLLQEHSPWLSTWYKESAFIKSPIEAFDLSILKIIYKYRLPQDWNNDEKYGPERYIEVHIWSDETINFSKGFDDIYLIEKDIDLSELKLQYEEVQNAKWASKEEILNMLEKEEFIPYYPSFINLVFDTRKDYGCHQK